MNYLSKFFTYLFTFLLCIINHSLTESALFLGCAVPVSLCIEYSFTPYLLNKKLQWRETITKELFVKAILW
jgi:hypothetical protein